MRTFLLAAVLALAGCASNPVGVVHAATHQLTMTFLDGHGGCSGTAIGHHAVLTAEHCLVDAIALQIDGKDVAVKTVLLDHADHAIVITDETYDDYVGTAGEPGQGAKVFICGNPGDLTDQCRYGSVSGYHVEANQKWTLYDLNGFFGDSGSGIFNEDGFLVGVISIEVSQSHSDAYIKLMGSLPLAFTKEQWKVARG